MNIVVTYENISEERAAKILAEDNVVNVKIIPDTVKGITQEQLNDWVNRNCLDGVTTSLAVQMFTADFHCDGISQVKFNKMVVKTGEYVTKNVRIAGAVQLCFVKKMKDINMSFVQWNLLEDGHYPKDIRDVLICTNCGEMCLGYYNGGSWHLDEDYPSNEITAWMALPKPYRKDK